MADEAIVVGGAKTTTLKKAIAKILYSLEVEQTEISKILNLSQPMVSNYCSSKDKISKDMLDFAEEISNKIMNGNHLKFQTCITFSDKSFMGTYYLASKNEIISDENSRVINNLTEAFLNLKGKNFNGIIPKVKINIAMAKEQSLSSDDIAAFLNGLILLDDKITGYNGIHFGKSKHLSSLLLKIREYLDVNAIMNIAYIRNLDDFDFSVSYLTKEYKLIDNKKEVDVLLHKGDFGIEPCAYILGKDAVDVSKKALRILEGLNNEK